MGKGGGGGGQTQSTVTNTNVPEYARPYVESMLGATQNQLFNTSTDAQGNTVLGSPKPYQAYGGTYDQNGNMTSYDPSAAVAGFSPLQQQAQQGIAGLQMPGQFDAASQYTADAMQRAANAGYNSGQFTMGQAQAPDVNYYQMNQPQDIQGQNAQGANLGNAPTAYADQMQAAQLGYAPDMQGQIGYASQLGDAAQMQAEQAGITQLGNAPTYQGQQLGYTPQNVGYDRVTAPQLRDLQMQAAGNVGTQSFTQPGTADAYMSSFMQKAIDPQIREAQRQADIASTKRSAQMGQLGAFGGSREALENAEAARNTEQLKSDIEAKGLQSAYQSAQSQFNTEQQNALNAALANQQVQQQTGVQNLSALLQTQGLGAQTGLTAQQLNQAAGMQTGQFNQQQQYNTALQNAQLAQQQQLANQSLQGQYGLTQGQMNQAVNLQNAAQRQAANAANQGALNQYGLQQGSMNQQMAMANLANQQQAAVNNQALQGQYGLQQGQFNQAANAANQQANNQIALANQALQGQYGLTQGQLGQANAQFNAQQNQAANLANQQMAYNTGLQNLQANLGVQQLGAGQNLQAQLANQQAMLANQQAIEQSRQFGANYGQQMNAQQLAAAQQLGGLGQQQLAAQQGIYGLQNQVGGQQQQMQQQIINQAMQDYSNTQQYPLMQLGTMSNMLRGLPMQAATTNMYQAAPNAITQGIGAVGAYGALSNAFGSPTGKKEGGVIKAAQGGIMSYDVGGEIESTLSKMDVDELKKYAKESNSPTIKQMAARLIQEKMPVPGMARGGILAFAKSTEENNQSLVDASKSLGTEAGKDLGTFPDPTSALQFFGVSPESSLSKGLKSYVENRNKNFNNLVNQGIVLEGKPTAPPTPTPAAAQPAPAPVTQPAPAAPPVAPTASAPAGIAPPAPAPAPVARPPAGPAPAGIAQAAAATPPAPRPTAGIPAPSMPAEGQDIALIRREAEAANTAAGKSLADIAKERMAAEKERGIGPNTDMAEYRSKIMAERANMDDEAKRQKNLRLAEFFASWGSTPGATLVAGMTALRKTIPSIMEDEKERKKALRETDKIIYELGQAERLEKKGDLAADQEMKTKLADRASKLNATLAEAAGKREATAAHLAGQTYAAQMGVKGHEISAGATVTAAKLSADAHRASIEMQKETNDIGKAQAAWQAATTARDAIERDYGNRTKADDYVAAKNTIALQKNNKTPEIQALVTNAENLVNSVENGFKTRREAMDKIVRAAETRVGMNPTGATMLGTDIPAGHKLAGYTPDRKPVYQDSKGNKFVGG